MPLFARELQRLPILNMASDEIPDFRQKLLRVPIFVIDNVAQYVQAQSPLTGRTWRLGALAPPFPELWIEYRITLRSGAVQYYGGMLSAKVNGHGWQMNFKLYGAVRGGDHAFCHCDSPCELDGHGQLIESQSETRLYLIEGVDQELLRQVVQTGLCPMHLALMFCHCKNVVRVEHAPDPALVKRSRERGNPVPLKYHTLEIEPMKQVLRTEGQIEKVGLERALHICRGHFAHYGEDGPGLFGKGLHGDFWIPQHVRGTEKRGVVISDYNVNAPKDGGLQMKEPDGA
jgi:hypothetical protein